MSELVQIWVVVLSGFCVFSLVLAMFACSNGDSNFESFVKAWKEKRLAECEVEKERLRLEAAKFGTMRGES